MRQATRPTSCHRSPSTPALRFARPLACGLVALALIATPAQAALVTYTWTPTVAGTLYDWNNAAYWGGVAFPNSGGATNGHYAKLSNNIAGDQTVRLNQVISLYRMDIGDTGADPDSSYSVVANGGSFVFDYGASGTFTLNGVGTASAGNSIAADILLNSNLTVDNVAGNLLTISGNITTSTGKTLTKTGAGTLVLTGSNSFASTTISGGGMLAVNSDAALGAAPTSLTTNITISGGSTLRFDAAMTINSNRRISLGTGGATLNTQGFNVSAGTVIGGNALTKTGAGTLTLSESATLGTVTVNEGTLALSSGGTMSALTIASTGSMTTGGTISGFTGATINGSLTAGANVTLSSVSNLQVGGTLTMTAGTLSVYRGNGGPTGQITSGGSILLQGSSSFSLGTQQNAYYVVGSGAALDVGASASVTGTSFLSVEGTLRGSGTIDVGNASYGYVEIESGGRLAPGSGGIGTLNLAKGLTFATGSHFDVELGAPGASYASPGASDRAAVAGAVTLAGTLNLTNGGSAGAGAYKILTYTSGAPGSFSAVTNAMSASLHEKVTVNTTDKAVYVDLYRLAAPSAHSPAPVNLGSVIIGNAFPVQALTLQNTAANDGFSEKLNASLGGATGDVTASGSFTLLNPGATNSTSLLVGLTNTGTAGPKSGTATVTLNSNGSGTSGYALTALTSQVVNVSGTVLDPCTPSFSVTVQNSLDLDLGNWTAGSGVKTVAFQIYNLETTAGLTAAMDLDSFPGTGDTTTLYTDLSTFKNLAATGHKNFLAYFDTSVEGTFQAVYTLYVSDEDIPGAGTGYITLTLTGQVSPVPEPATLGFLLAGAGACAIGGVRRRLRGRR